MLSNQKLQFGIIVLPDLPFEQATERWQLVEALGFDSVWDCDHFANPHNLKSDWFEGWTLLAALCPRTSRIRVGSLVTNTALHNPALLARKAMTVDRISNGRLELALGTGGAPSDHSMTGIPLLGMPARVKRFEEFVNIVDAMLRNEVTSYAGDHCRVEDAIMRPGPVQRPRPPITIAAHGPRMLEITARYADCWNTYAGWALSPHEARELTRQRNEIIDDHCVRIGRNPKSIRRSFLVGLTQETPFASLDAFRDFIQAYLEIGIHEFVFYWMRDKQSGTLGFIDDRSVLEQVAQEAIPRLKADYSRSNS